VDPVVEVADTQAGLVAPGCDADPEFELLKAQTEVVWAIQRAASAYQANPSDPLAVESFGPPQRIRAEGVTQFSKVSQAFDDMTRLWALEAVAWEPTYICKPAVDDGTRGFYCAKDPVADARDQGKIVICNEKSFWFDPFEVLVHEYWHWLNWEDAMAEGSHDTVHQQLADPIRLAREKPDVTATNPESYARFVRVYR
jgi:hypothetical protein